MEKLIEGAVKELNGQHLQDRDIGLDIVVLPELFAYNPYTTLRGSAECVGEDEKTRRQDDGWADQDPDHIAASRCPARASNTLPHCSAWARQFATYVLCTLVERVAQDQHEGRAQEEMRQDESKEQERLEPDLIIYNSAVLLDRRGLVVGVYRKTFPTYGSYEEAGVTPGPLTKHTVFVTDFGRVGILMCFDVNFAQLWAQLDGEEEASQADIVVYPSAMSGTRLLSVYATIHNYYIVENGDSGEVFDIDGTIIQPLFESEDTLHSQHKSPGRARVKFVVLDLD